MPWPIVEESLVHQEATPYPSGMSRSRAKKPPTLTSWLALPPIACLLMVGCTPITDLAPEELPGAAPAPTASAIGNTPDQTELPILDGGPRPMANGTLATGPEGFLVYTVAEGDVGGVICARLGREWWQLETLDRQSGFDCNSAVYVGQVVVPTSASWDELVASDGIPEFRAN